MRFLTLSATLLVAWLVCCNLAVGDICEDPIITELGSLKLINCYKEETSRIGLKQLKMVQHLLSDSGGEPLMKSKRTFTEELVRCETLAGIPNHKISDFECLKYGAFINDSIFTNNNARENARFMKKFTMTSKSEMLGTSKGVTQLEIYPLMEEVIDQQVSASRDEFLGNRTDISTNSAYFVMNSIKSLQKIELLSGDIHLSIIDFEPTLVDTKYPDLVMWVGHKIINAADSGYVLNLKNIVVPVNGGSLELRMNFTMGQQKNFPYFFLENAITTNFPNFFDYNASITQDDTSDRYSTAGSYSTRITIDSKSNLPPLNFSLRQKFDNSGPEHNEWHETMLLDARHFVADVMAVAEDGFSKRLNVVDKLGRMGLQITYNAPSTEDTIDFNIHVDKSVLKVIFSNFAMDLAF